MLQVKQRMKLPSAKLRMRAVLVGSAVGISFSVIAWKGAPVRDAAPLFAGLAAHATTVGLASLAQHRRSEKQGNTWDHAPSVVVGHPRSLRVRRAFVLVPPSSAARPVRRPAAQAPKRGPPIARIS